MIPAWLPYFREERPSPPFLGPIYLLQALFSSHDTKFTVPFSFFMYGYRFLSRRFIHRREMLHGGSAAPRTGLLPFWGDSTIDGWVLGVNRGHMAGYASCWSTCSCPILSSPPISDRQPQLGGLYDGCCELPHWGLEQSLSHKNIWVYLEVKKRVR